MACHEQFRNIKLKYYLVQLIYLLILSEKQSRLPFYLGDRRTASHAWKPKTRT